MENGTAVNNSSANVADYFEESKKIAGGEKGEGRNETDKQKLYGAKDKVFKAEKMKELGDEIDKNTTEHQGNKKDKGTTEDQGNEGNNKEKQDLLPDKENPPVDNESSIIKLYG